MRREKTFTDQKSLNISSIQPDYINLDSSSGFVNNNERAHDFQTKFTFCGSNNQSAEKYFKRIRKKKENLALLMLHPIDKWNVRFGNALHVDLNIM